MDKDFQNYAITLIDELKTIILDTVSKSSYLKYFIKNRIWN